MSIFSISSNQILNKIFKGNVNIWLEKSFISSIPLTDKKINANIKKILVYYIYDRSSAQKCVDGRQS